MSNDKTLFDKALSNYSCARKLRNVVGDDEEELNIIAYHLQQALEFALKYVLEQNAVEYSKTHDIDQLIRLGKEANAKLYLTEYIEDHAEMFSLWESKARYVLGYLVELEKIDKAMPKIEEYFSTLHDKLS